MRIKSLCLLFTLVAVLLASAMAIAAPTASEITGEIEKVTLDDPANIYSGGIMIVGGTQVILPKNLLIDLPANRLSLQQIFAQAPAACLASNPRESGLAKSDKCNSSGTGGFVTLSAVHSDAGNIIAGDVLIEKGTDVVSGVVSYINYTDGYFRVNGILSDPATGAMVRLNDPTGRHTVQQGLGCAGVSNCSADPRFTLDPDNYVNVFSTGYPFCIPSTVPRTFADVLGLGTTTAVSTASGTGDVLCPSTNRSADLVEPPVNDSRLFAPLMVGDSVNAKGNFESINGVRFLSAHTTKVLKALSTQNLATQPDYLFLQEVFLEAPGFQNQRARMLIIGMTTLAPTDVDFWTLHRDPVSNAIHEFPLASINGCDVAAGVSTCSNQGLIGAGANIFRIRYDVDFLLAAAGDPKFPGGAAAKLNPCMQLQGSARFAVSYPGICNNGISLANNFGIMSPIPHEIQARTGHSLDHPGLITLDIRGNQATNGQYLFPFGINLGGVETADFLEVDVNLLTTPRVFEGIPWNLDRRLSPGGCLKAGGCESLITSPLGAFALDPFPYTGLDPRTQADFCVGPVGACISGGTPKVAFTAPQPQQYTNSTLSNASNRVFSYVSGTPFALGKYNFDGDNTLLPYAMGSFPAIPVLVTINPTPILNIFPPIADEDAAVTSVGNSVVIPVLANDFAVLGTIAPLSLTISTPPASGTAVVNLPAGTITYTPASGAIGGTVAFAYTVANNFGAVSLPGTVTVTIQVPPTAVTDAASVAAKSSIPVNVVANDTAGTSLINLATVSITSGPTCGSLVNQADGIVAFTAPNAVPAAPGTCTFTYVVSDTSVPPLLSNVATVTLTITPPAAPAAVNDVAATTTGSPVDINVIFNDTSAVSSINPASLSVSVPTGGTAFPNAAGTVTYMPPVTPGTYTFTYTVQDNAVPPATSNVASVTVTVTAPIVPPTAVNDSATVVANSSVIINVAANDIAGTNPIIPLTATSVTVSAAPVNGTAVANAGGAGTVTYTPAISFNGTDSFTYNIKDTLGNVSATNATVFLTVTTPTATETITITRAQYTLSSGQWRIDGTTTARIAGQTMKFFNSPAVPADAVSGLLGTANVAVNGSFTWTSANGAVLPNGLRRISALSSINPNNNKIEQVIVTVR